MSTCACSAEENTIPPIVHDNSHLLLMSLLLVQGFPLTNMHLISRAHLLITRNHLQHKLNLHCMYTHPFSTSMLPHSHLICTKPLYHPMPTDPIIFILINLLTHLHILLIHNSHHLLILMFHHHISRNTRQPLAHLFIVVILQSYWLYKSNGNTKKN